MTLRELGKLLPKAQPSGLVLHKGETVYLRMKRCSHLLFEAKITQLNLDVVKAALDSSDLVRMTLSTGVDYEFVKGDHIFTAEWINTYAGEELVEIKPFAAQTRMGRLAHLINRETS